MLPANWRETHVGWPFQQQDFVDCLLTLNLCWPADDTLSPAIIRTLCLKNGWAGKNYAIKMPSDLRGNLARNTAFKNLNNELLWELVTDSTVSVTHVKWLPWKYVNMTINLAPHLSKEQKYVHGRGPSKGDSRGLCGAVGEVTQLWVSVTKPSWTWSCYLGFSVCLHECFMYSNDG